MLTKDLKSSYTTVATLGLRQQELDLLLLASDGAAAATTNNGTSTSNHHLLFLQLQATASLILALTVPQNVPWKLICWVDRIPMPEATELAGLKQLKTAPEQSSI